MSVSLIDGHIDDDVQMTDNEIIKALECCTKGTTSDVCDDCPLRTTDICTEEENGVLKLALDLINFQKANAEGLTNAVKYLNEQLSSAKAEAVKEFAERLKLHSYFECSITGHKYQVVQIEDIDNLVKEMVGDG